MIASLRGTLLEKTPGACVVEAGGVGYLVQVSSHTAAGLPAAGQPVFLRTRQIVREDAVQLFGFAEAEELELFDLMIAVSGVGPRLALAVLSGLRPQALRRAIREEQVGLLTSVPGIGKKTAERLVVELRDKLEALPLPGAASPRATAACCRAPSAGATPSRRSPASGTLRRRLRRPCAGPPGPRRIRRWSSWCAARSPCWASRSRQARRSIEPERPPHTRSGVRAPSRPRRRPRGAARGPAGGAAAPPAGARGVRRAAGAQGAAAHLPRGGPAPRRGARPRALPRPARARQDHAGLDPRARAGRRDHPHLGAGHRAPRRPGRAAHEPAAARHPVRGRDPPHEPGGRGVPLPGARGLHASTSCSTAAPALARSRSTSSASRWSAPRRARACCPRRCAPASASPCGSTTTAPRTSRASSRARPASSRWRPSPTPRARSRAGRAARPRVANRLLRRVRDFALIRADAKVTLPVTREALRDAGRGRARARRDGPPAARGAHPEVRRRPRRPGHAGRGRGRGARHARGGLRAVPHPGGLPQAHAARPRGHGARLRAPRPEAARRRVPAPATPSPSCRSPEPGRRALLRPRGLPMRLEDLDYDLPPGADRAAPGGAPRGRAPARGRARDRRAARLAHRRARALAAARRRARPERDARAPRAARRAARERRARRAADRAPGARRALARAREAREEGPARRGARRPTTAA